MHAYHIGKDNRKKSFFGPAVKYKEYDKMQLGSITAGSVILMNAISVILNAFSILWCKCS